MDAANARFVRKRAIASGGQVVVRTNAGNSPAGARYVGRSGERRGPAPSVTRRADAREDDAGVAYAGRFPLRRGQRDRGGRRGAQMREELTECAVVGIDRDAGPPCVILDVRTARHAVVPHEQQGIADRRRDGRADLDERETNERESA